ncbi:MAG: hypothetical protein ABWZ26_01125 [Candidatus Nanopelagicales bacterium]
MLDMFDHLHPAAYDPSLDEAASGGSGTGSAFPASSTTTAEGLAFDRSLPPWEALGRIRDAFHDYDHSRQL